ncbi:MAG TPA: N-acetylmuramic acid 6-phosphate etherase [Methylomirabilota bacterium]|nr:N-acetylmuramic acid 6-phosphate etherase [Methylomirabilota bacterium]
MRIQYSRLPTEKPNPRSRTLDRLTPLQIVALMNREDKHAVKAVGRARRQIARGIALISRTLAVGGRLFFVGAGTSGRLGVLEAAECPPTFNTTPSQVQALMAGGRGAVFRSREGAEDRESEARRLVRARVRAGDVVVGIAASGVTPFVRAALAEAKRRRARRILVACNAESPLTRLADLVIAVRVGPEVLTGSTRLKAGSATKMTLNMLTTASMVQLGKVYGNWMVDLRPNSKKLKARALRLIEQLGRVSSVEAHHYLARAHGRAKAAIVMARTGEGYDQALRKLAESHDSLRVCLKRAKPSEKSGQIGSP